MLPVGQWYILCYVYIHVGAEEDRVSAAGSRPVPAAAAVKAPSMTNVMSDIGASAQSEQQVCVFVCWCDSS